MKVNSKQRKKATRRFQEVYGKDELANRMFHILSVGKQGIDALVQELGIMMPRRSWIWRERNGQVLTIFPDRKGCIRGHTSPVRSISGIRRCPYVIPVSGDRKERFPYRATEC